MHTIKPVFILKRLFVFFLFCLFFRPGLCGAEIQQPDRVVVAVGSDSVPFYFLDKDDSPAGMVVDIWKLWSRKTGIEVVFRPSSFADSLKAVVEGKADIHAGCYYSEQRDTFLDFISPVAKARTHFFFRRNIFGVKNLEDLRGFRIGIIKGDVAAEYLKKKMPQASLAVYSDNVALFDAVEAGDIVAFVKDTRIGLEMLAQRGMSHQFRYYEKDPLYEAGWYCAVRKGDQRFAGIIREGMAAISPEEKEAVVQRWTGVPFLTDDDVLTVACSLDYPPFSMISESGNPSGMLVDLWKLWASKTGRKIRFRFFNWEDTLTALENGYADIHSGLFRLPERDKIMDFSRPFYQVQTGFFYKLGPGAPKRLSDLNGRKVGVEAGTMQFQHLKDHYKAVQTVIVPPDKNLLQEASRNSFDAFLAELPNISARLERRGEKGAFGLLPGGRFTCDLQAGVAKRDKLLLETVNKGLDAITPGELADIEARWISDPGLRRQADAILTVLSPEEKAFLKDNAVIPVVGESDWPPLDFADDTGGYKGVAADYLKLIGDRLGVRFEVITDYNWNRMVELSKKRKVAGIACIAKNPDRERFLNFSKPYFVCPYVIVSRRETSGISGIEDLSGKKTAIEDGYLLHERLKDEYPRIPLVTVKNTPDALEAVREHKAEAYIGNLMVIRHLFREKGISDLKITSHSPWEGSRLSMGIRNDWPLLVSAIDKAIDSITPFEHREINRRWLEGGFEKPVPSFRSRLSPEEEAWLSKQKVVIVTSESNWPPISFVDSGGLYRGVTADYLDLIRKRLGLRMEVITDYPWNQMIDMTRDRKVDLITAIVKNTDREEFLDFSDPYFVSPYVLVTRRSMPEIRNISDLTGKTIAVEKGFYLHRQLEREYPDIKLLLTENTTDALRSVALGEADAYAGNLMVISYLLKLEGITGLKVACPTPWPSSQLRLGIRSDWPQLTSAVNKALDDISPEEHKAINLKWMDFPHPEDRVAAGVGLSPEEEAWLAEHPVFRLGVDSKWCPIEFLSENNVYSGLAPEYMKRIEKRLGSAMDVQTGLTWPQALEKGKQKEIDIFPCICPTPERKKYLDFTKPYLNFPMVIAAETDFPFTDSLDALEGKRVAVVKRHVSMDILKRNHSHINLIEADSVEDALTLLSKGGADAFVGNLASITYFTRKMGLTNIKIAATTPYQYSLSIGVRKDWPELVSILDKVLDSINEAEKNEIRSSWITMRFEHGVNWGLFWKWMLVVVFVSGTVLGIILYSNRKLKREIRERKRVEDALAEMEELSRLILESVGEGIIGQDAGGRCIFVNRAALTMLDYEAGELLGEQIHDKIHHSKPDASAYPLEECSMCMGFSGAEMEAADEVFWRRDGSCFQIRYTRTGIFRNGKVEGAVIVFRDVTERKKAEDQLRKLSTAVEQSPVSVIITDTEGFIEYVNPTFTTVTGYTALEAAGQNSRALQSEYVSAEAFKHLWKTISSGKIWQGEMQNRKKCGDLFWESVTISPVFSEQGEIINYLGIKEDITRKKHMEQSLIESHEQLSEAVAVAEEERKKAEVADRAKSEFLANMSHEIRTPMNAIIGMAHLAMQTALDVKQRDYVSKIDMSARSLLGLINDILDFSKIEAGKMDMESLEFRLDETLENLSGLISVKTAEKPELEILFRVDPRAPNILVGDPLRLNQVLVNLGNNAVKFTEKGHIVVEVGVVEISDNAATLKFSVTDSGIGMTDAQQKRLFRAFSQGDTSTTRKYGGTGLGLIISKRIVTMMGGDIRLESRYGEGSTFSFTVPFGIGKGDDARFMPEFPSDMAGLRALVIDDNRYARIILSEMLTAFSFDVDEAESADGGIAMIRNAGLPYDVVFVDAHMPGTGGRETAGAIRDLRLGDSMPRIISVSAHADYSAVPDREKTPVDGTLVKPFSHSGLFNAIAGAFGRQDAGDRLVSRRRQERVRLPREVMGARLLLVEDHGINQQVAMEILEGAGFFVKVADNGREGFEMALAEEFDLVLMDLQMPVMDGYEATRMIRVHKSADRLPVIAMTASAMASDRERAIAMGMNDHVSKPIDIGELFGKLSRWIKPGRRTLPDAFTLREADAESRTADLADVPGIAVARALSRLDGNKGLYLDLTGKFRRDYADAERQLKEMIDSGDDIAGRRLAHSIKGVAGNLGITDLQAAAESLETAFRNGEKSRYGLLMESFGSSLAVALSSIDILYRESAPPETGQVTAEGIEALAPLLSELYPYIKDREARPAKQIMEKITGFAWSAGLASEVTKLDRLVSGYKFKQAQEMLDRLIINP